MLANINISNLEISNNESSIYSDACENSIQLEEEYKKFHDLELNKQKKETDKNINENNDIKYNKIENLNILDKFLESKDLENKNFSKYELNESYSNNQNLFNKNNINNINNNNNEIMKEIKEKNINNRYIVNKNINCNNINKINLSNVNIIINNNNNNERNEKKDVKNHNLENNENIDKNLSNKSIKSIKQIDDKNDKNNIVINDIKKDNKFEENLGNNSCINDIITKNINNNNELFNQNLIKRNSLHFSSTSNLDFNIFNDFENITTIMWKKKRGTINNLSKSTVLNQNKSISFSVKDNSMSVNNCKFENISYNQIDLNYLKHLRTIPIKSKKKGKRYLKTLLELQNFFVESSDIRVIKISEDGKYLSVGLENGKIKLYEILGYDYNKYESSYNKKNIMEYLNFIKEKAFKSLEGHKEDIIDLSWSSFYHYLLLSSSVDGYVILWNVNLPEKLSKIECFNHEKIVTCVSFSPTEKNIFITGCLDKIIRIWDITNIPIEKDDNKKINKNINTFEKYNKDYFNIEEKITSLNFSPSGKEIIIGTHNGKIIKYESRGDKYFYAGSFTCRNRLGKNSFGKKITSIEYLNNRYAIISSCDSRIRLLSMNDGKIICKYKGHLNENSMIKADYDHNYDIIISGSEDGFVYVWDLYNIDNNNKNSNYEYFKPYSHETIQCSLIVPEKIYCNFVKKILRITNKLMISSIIINATNEGRLEILLNIDDEY